MTQNDLAFLERQNSRIAKVVQGDGGEDDKLAAIAREFSDYAVKMRVVPTADSIHKAGDAVRPYFDVWAALVCLPVAFAKPTWWTLFPDKKPGRKTK